jgi:hypothetical protein
MARSFLVHERDILGSAGVAHYEGEVRDLILLFRGEVRGVCHPQEGGGGRETDVGIDRDSGDINRSMNDKRRLFECKGRRRKVNRIYRGPVVE